MVDYRKGLEKEPDVIRVGPHFYTDDEEIDILLEAIENIYKTGEYKQYSDKIGDVT
jgi:kynureninase